MLTSTCLLGNLLVFCRAFGVCRSTRKSLALYVLVSPVTAGLRNRAVEGDTVINDSMLCACGGVVRFGVDGGGI